MEVITAVVLGIAFLFVFYRAVQLHWPESYFGANDLAAYAISASPIRYVLFRFAPPYVTCLFVAVSLERVGSAWRAGTLAVGVGHALATSGWALVQAARWPPTVFRHRVPIVIVRVVVMFGLGLVALLAVVTAPAFEPLVPEVSEISATLWTGLAAGVVGAFFVRVSRGQPINEYELAVVGVRSVPRPLWEQAERVAREAGADPVLVRAVMVVENLQRPRWFRRLERIKGKFFRKGTYGIMQIGADRPLTDEESIERAVHERFRGVSVRRPDGEVDDDALRAFAHRYNPSPNFALLLHTAIYEVQGVSEAVQ